MAHRNLRYVGDPNARIGFWGEPDSLANFCEEDYVVVNFIAEFINTLTNLAYIYYAIAYPPKSASGTPWYRKLDFMSISLIAVGICSGVFHGTMRLVPQYCDDLSMLLLAGALLHAPWVSGRSQSQRHLIAWFVGTVVVGLSLLFVLTGNLLVHSVAFVVLLTFAWPRALYLVYRGPKGEGRSGTKEQQARTKVMLGHFMRAFLGVAIGFAAWNVDLEMCLGLRELKASLGLPFSWVLELHGWWHVLTAYGASHFIRMVRMATEGDDLASTGAAKQKKMR